MANSFIDDFVWSGKKEFLRVRFFLFWPREVELPAEPRLGQGNVGSWLKTQRLEGNIPVVMVVLASSVKPYSTLRFVRLIALP